MPSDPWRAPTVAVLVCVLMTIAVGRAEAGGGGEVGFVSAPATPVQLALGPPGIQVFTYETPVYGMSLSLLQGDQKTLYGLGLGLFSDASHLAGIQVGAGNNVSGDLHGMQVGVANTADSGAGLQVGLWNRSHSMRGLQIGLLNFNDEGLLPVLPFLNVGLGGDDHD